MSDHRRPILAITLGDPGGIGPEIAAKALALKETYQVCRPLLIGTKGLVEMAIKISGLSGFEVKGLDHPGRGRYRFGTLEVMDLANFPIEELKHKTVTKEQGKASFEFVVKAIDLALAGQVDATVTGPINNSSINAAGFKYSGHTEIYAEKTGTRDYAMMLADGNFRVSHVSTHLSLRQACDRVKKERIGQVIELTAQALVKMGIDEPKIAVAGLNPHCGEDGLFGYEEEREIKPAVVEAQGRGLLVEGPIAADTVFSKALGGQYHAVVVMYHDQGHIPAKLIGFKYDQNSMSWAQLAGVNLTLGLPIIRTSVDHGTAFGKAGEGRANPQSLIEAINLAAKLATRKSG
ncbi:MAG: 4-hydroxythreonine-4-phosphate dehydrogenase PdxA [Deltaproteobacteria bacterium]|jgi:4-hydroxythreonine-4-phosphate dehydrogenase|nr:4-hydroxythreonine-4-phosphate dehydrogenase PdxA [Deltaproteobacteria bacterium]